MQRVRFASAIVLTAVLVAASASIAGAQSSAGALVRAALQGLPLSARELPELSDADRLRVAAYLERRDAQPARSSARDIAALVEAATPAEAEAVAKALKKGGEGSAEMIAAAEQYLRSHPETVVAPYLYATIALQLRAAIERDPDPDVRGRFARRYKTMLDRLRGHEDGIWRLIADDLDAVPSVTGRAAAHPRDFLPPG